MGPGGEGRPFPQGGEGRPFPQGGGGRPPLQGGSIGMSDGPSDRGRGAAK
jgi:hypothetical protein